MASRKRRHHKGGVPRGAAPFVMNRYTLRQVKWLLQCQHKVHYPDRKAALRARDAIFERTGDWLHPYKCRMSGIAPKGNGGGAAHYHLGHRGYRRLVMRELIEEWE